MSEFSSIDDLFGNGVTETAVVDIPSGGRVKVRGLTRYEHLLIGREADGDGADFEPRMLSMCVVDPVMTLDQAKRWHRSAKPRDIGAVSDKIRDLSGLGDGAAKSEVPADGEQ